MNMAPPFQKDAEEHWKYLSEVLRRSITTVTINNKPNMIMSMSLEAFLEYVGFHYITAMVHGFGHGYEQGFPAGAFMSDLNPNQKEREAAQRGGETNES